MDEIDDIAYEDGEEYDWLYVEDHYDEADELAEHTCPSPANEPDVIDYDPYDYFQDVEYLSDSFYDRGAQPQDRGPPPLPRAAPGRKRKRNDEPEHDPLVLWKSAEQRQREADNVETVAAGSLPRVTLFSNWRQKYDRASGVHFKFRRHRAGEGENAAQLAETEHEEEDGAAESAEGQEFDLDDPESLARLLGDEHIQQLQKMAEAQGLDPAAVQAVLNNMVHGTAPDLASDDDDEEDEGAGDAEAATARESANATRSQSTRASEARHASSLSNGTRGRRKRAPDEGPSAASGSVERGAKRARRGAGEESGRK